MLAILCVKRKTKTRKGWNDTIVLKIGNLAKSSWVTGCTLRCKEYRRNVLSIENPNTQIPLYIFFRFPTNKTIQHSCMKYVEYV